MVEEGIVGAQGCGKETTRHHNSHNKVRRTHSCPQPFDMIVQALCHRHTSDSDALAEARKALLLMMHRQGKGLDLDAINASGMTALTQCALDGSLRGVKILLELGADVDKTDRYGWAPLHHAAAEGYIDIVRLLLRANANVRALNQHGHMPMDLADDEAVRKLLIRVTLFYSPIGRTMACHCSLPVWL